MEHIPATHAAVVGRHYTGRVSRVGESDVGLVLDLTEPAPGRSPILYAGLRFDQTVTPERARRLAPRDPVEAVLIEVHPHPPHNGRLVASLPANPAWLAWNDETVRRLARHVRATGELGLLPVLADALEDAGCRDAALLEHCRQFPADGGRSWVAELLATQE
jgi:hypothetical protein